MKKAIAILFLFLYGYNLLGYYVVFKILQHQVRADVKSRMVENAPATEFVLIAVPKDGGGSFDWLDGDEFCFRGDVYDVALQYSTADTQYYVCVNDMEEERLFKNLDLYVSAQWDAEDVPPQAAGPFQGIFKEYVGQAHALGPASFQGTLMGVTPDFSLTTHTEDVPTPPPRPA